MIILTLNTVQAGVVWNGISPISNMWIYNDYFVVEQGDVTGGDANCTNNGAWSARWDDFSSAQQKRILSSLYLAKATNRPLQVHVSDEECGPENLKKFMGGIDLR